MTPEQRRVESRRICEAATPEPWECPNDQYGPRVRYQAGKDNWCLIAWTNGEYETQWQREDAVFCAHARTALPAALDALDAAEQRLAELEDENERLSRFETAYSLLGPRPKCVFDLCLETVDESAKDRL